MTACPTCGAPVPAANATTAAELRALHAHRSGPYAEAYRLGLRMAAGDVTAALDEAAHGQGYRDGRALRPYRLPTPGRGAVARKTELQKIRREKNKLKIDSK